MNEAQCRMTTQIPAIFKRVQVFGEFYLRDPRAEDLALQDWTFLYRAGGI